MTQQTSRFEPDGELPSRAKRNLGLAIAAILFIYANANTTALAQDASRGGSDGDTNGGDWLNGRIVVTPDYPSDSRVVVVPWMPEAPDPLPDPWDDYAGGSDSGTTGSDNVGNPKDAEKRVPCDNPVDISTGKKFEEEIDFYSRSNNGLRMVRNYNQSWSGRGYMGSKWITYFDQKISFDTPWGYDGVGCYPVPGAAACNVANAAEIYVHSFDGNVTRFIADGPGKWKGSEEAPLAQINWLAQGYYEVVWPDGRIQVFLASGEIRMMLAPDATGLTFNYDASRFPVTVSHTSGRTINVTKTGNLITGVTDPNGSSYAYGYTNGYLTSVQTPDGKGNLTYHYEQQPGDLTGISISGQRYAYYTYDATQRVTSTKKANGADQKYYAYFSDRTERTNSLGRKTTYFLTNGSVTGISGLGTANCPAFSTSSSADAEGRANLRVDARGTTTDLDFDTNGRIQQVVEAPGQTISRTKLFEWDPVSGDMTKETLVGLRETTYGHDLYRRPTFVTARNLGPGAPNQLRTTTWSYTNHPNGLIATTTMDGPKAGAGDSITYNYNTLGDLISVSNQLGQATLFSNHNAFGQARHVVDPNGQIVDYTYDSVGRLTSQSVTINGIAQATTFRYNSAGRLDQIVDPVGRVTNQYYDSIGRVSKIELIETANLKQQTLFFYDANSQPTEIRRQRVAL